jgi:apolipoprotein N-acyltransferase
MVAMKGTAIGAALLSALLMWAASPAVGVGWLAWVALVPVAAVILRAPRTPASRIAVPLAYAVYLELLLVPALPFGIAEGQWGEAALPVMIGDSPVLPVALVAIPLFGLLLYLIRFGEPWGAELLGPRLFTVTSIMVPAVAWTTLDLLRVKLDPGGSWGPLFLSQVETPASDLAALGGPWLVTLAIVAFGYGLALALVRRRPAPALVPAATIAAAVVLAPAIDGAQPAGRTVTVAAVQPGYDTAEFERDELRHWRPGTFNLAARDLLRDLAGPTRRAARDGAELVVWPEAVTFVDLVERHGARTVLLRVARDSRVTIVAPYFDHVSRRGAAIAVSPDRRLTAPRPKQRPMWFLGERGGDPPGPRPLQAAGISIGTLLGVDVQDPSLPRLLAARDAELIASSTHDWRQLAPQHRSLAALGAHAAGVPVVRADWRYGSAIYGRDGAAIADAGEDRRRTVVAADVETGSPTPYARIGDVVGWASLAAALAAGLAALAAWFGASRAGGRAFGGRAPGRESPRRRPSPAPPRAGGGPSPPPA